MDRCPGCDAPIEGAIVCDLCWELLPDGLKLELADALLNGRDLAELYERAEHCARARVMV